MATVNVTWVDTLRFVGTDSIGHSLVMAPPEQAVGLKPSDLLLLALGGCTGVDVAGIMAKQRQRVTAFRLEVRGEQAPEPPWAFERIHVVYQVSGERLNRLAIERAIALSEAKYCSIWQTLTGAVTLTGELVLDGEEAP